MQATLHDPTVFVSIDIARRDVLTPSMIEEILARPKKYLLSYGAQLLTSESLLQSKRYALEWKRNFRKEAHVVHFFHRVDDPYSYLLLQVLPNFLKQFDVELVVYIVPRTRKVDDPAPEERRAYALLDAYRLGEAYRLDFPDVEGELDPQDIDLANAICLAVEDSEKFLDVAEEVGHALFHRNRAKLDVLAKLKGIVGPSEANERLSNNEEVLTAMGHYYSAMLHYNGEWYWGIDRIHHLIERLALLGLGDAYSLRRDRYVLPGYEEPVLELFFSFRSPYSYLALKRVYEFVDAYDLDLDIRPVLPMVMRGLSVSDAKKFYIVSDAAREARLLGVPFGRIIDPVGSAVERCLAVYPAARDCERGREFLLAAAKGIWAERRNPNNNSDLRGICKEAGVPWKEAKQALARDDWQDEVAENRQDLLEAGLWGVPCMRLQGCDAIWGQDRIWMLEDTLLHHAEESTQ